MLSPDAVLHQPRFTPPLPPNILSLASHIARALPPNHLGPPLGFRPLTTFNVFFSNRPPKSHRHRLQCRVPLHGPRQTVARPSGPSGPDALSHGVETQESTSNLFVRCHNSRWIGEDDGVWEVIADAAQCEREYSLFFSDFAVDFVFRARFGLLAHHRDCRPV